MKNLVAILGLALMLGCATHGTKKVEMASEGEIKAERELLAQVKLEMEVALKEVEEKEESSTESMTPDITVSILPGDGEPVAPTDAKEKPKKNSKWFRKIGIGTLGWMEVVLFSGWMWDSLW